jgi:hypothetical protein
MPRANRRFEPILHSYNGKSMSCAGQPGVCRPGTVLTISRNVDEQISMALFT